MKKAIMLLMVVLAGCAHPGQNRYGYQDVGKATTVEFGTVVSSREVDITGKNTGAGAAAGTLAGGLGGSMIGHGDGSIGGLIAGVIVGAAVGAIAEQALADHKGIEYVVTLRDGKTLTIVQNKKDDEAVLRKGARVMVQTQGQYQRVLPAEDLPTHVKRAKSIKVVE